MQNDKSIRTIGVRTNIVDDDLPMDRRRLRRINQREELRKRNLPRELNTVQLRIEPRGQVRARTQAIGRINHSDGASGVGYVDPHDGPLLSRGRLVVKRDSGRKRMVGAASSIEENLSRMDSCMHAITPESRGRLRCKRRGARTLNASRPLCELKKVSPWTPSCRHPYRQHSGCPRNR